jgi:hypothetical protein
MIQTMGPVAKKELAKLENEVKVNEQGISELLLLSEQTLKILEQENYLHKNIDTSENNDHSSLELFENYYCRVQIVTIDKYQRSLSVKKILQIMIHEICNR